MNTLPNQDTTQPISTDAATTSNKPVNQVTARRLEREAKKAQRSRQPKIDWDEMYLENAMLHGVES